MTVEFEDGEEETLVERVILEILFEEGSDVDDFPEIFEGQFWKLLEDGCYDVNICCESCQNGLVQGLGVEVFFVSQLHLDMSQEYL